MTGAELAARVVAIADMDGSAADQCAALYEVADTVRLGIERPFVYVKVEGGLAELGGDAEGPDMDAIIVDFDVSEHLESSIEELDDMVEQAESIPDRLASLPHNDPRWLDRDGILTSLRGDLAERLSSYYGYDVFVNDDGIVPRCDICNEPQDTEGDDWNGDTGAHHSCEDPQHEEAAGT